MCSSDKQSGVQWSLLHAPPRPPGVCELIETMGSALGREPLKEMEGLVKEVIGDGRVGLARPQVGGEALHHLLQLLSY